jgi:hypothetical protein
MPWSESSPPDAAKGYSPRCRRAFVAAANSTLEKTKDEGRAMAAGHAAAKQCEGKKSMDGLTKFNFELGTADRPLIASFDPETKKRRIEGISSSTLRDGHGDEITLKALEQMAKSAVGMTVWLNHKYEVPDDVFGTITRARVVETHERDEKTGLPIWDLMCGMEVDEDNDRAIRTHSQIMNKRKLGISVGAMVNDGGVQKSQDGGRFVIDDVDLIEMSIVGVPANPRCWATVATKALNGEPFQLGKELNDLDADEREGRQTSKVDVEEGTDPDGATDGIVTGPDIMTDKAPDPDAPPPAAEAAEAEVEGEDGQKDKESVEEGGESDGIVTTDDLPGLEAPPEGEAKKTRVTVWDGDKTVEIDTGRTRKTGDDHSAQGDSPESAGGLPSASSKALLVGASTEMLLVKQLRVSLTRAVERAEEAEKERDLATEQAADAIRKAGEIIDAIGKLPMGRRATFDDVKKSADQDLDSALGNLSFLDESDRKLLIRRNREVSRQDEKPNLTT